MAHPTRHPVTAVSLRHAVDWVIDCGGRAWPINEAHEMCTSCRVIDECVVDFIGDPRTPSSARRDRGLIPPALFAARITLPVGLFGRLFTTRSPWFGEPKARKPVHQSQRSKLPARSSPAGRSCARNAAVAPERIASVPVILHSAGGSKMTDLIAPGLRIPIIDRHHGFGRTASHVISRSGSTHALRCVRFPGDGVRAILSRSR